MEDLKGKADALDKTAQSISKYTMGWLVIIVLVYSYFLYTVARNSAEDSNNILYKENDRLNAELKTLRSENVAIYRELLQRNGIIDKQKEVIKIADSAAVIMRK